TLPGWAGERIARFTNTPCAPEPGKNEFHRVPDFSQNEWDAAERVLTILGGFRGRGWPLPSGKSISTFAKLRHLTPVRRILSFLFAAWFGLIGLSAHA